MNRYGIRNRLQREQMTNDLANKVEVSGRNMPSIGAGKEELYNHASYLGRKASVFEQSEQIGILSVHIAAYLNGCS